MRVELDEATTTAHATSAVVRIDQDPGDDIPHELDENERGLKDTVRVNANEVVDIAVRFSSYAGRYMYHCHILEHEDRDMMRPFVVMPAELMPFM
jgi:o-aminophenol oxidase